MAINKYTVVESNNIAMGQGGVDYLNGTDTYVPPTGLVVIAITFTEDTIFSSGTTVESTNFTSQSTEGAGAEADAFGSDTFPAGLTIYGRFTAVDLSSGKALLYLGP